MDEEYGGYEPDDFEEYNRNEALDYMNEWDPYLDPDEYDGDDDYDTYNVDPWQMDDRPRRPCVFVCDDSVWINSDLAPVDQVALCPHPSHWHD